MELTVSVGFLFVAVAVVSGQWLLGSRAVCVCTCGCVRVRYSTEFHVFFQVRQSRARARGYRKVN